MGKYAALAKSHVEMRVNAENPKAKVIHDAQSAAQYQIWVYDKQIKEIQERFGNDIPADWMEKIHSFETGKGNETEWIVDLEAQK